MIIKMNQTSVLYDIKKELETYLLTQSFISLKEQRRSISLIRSEAVVNPSMRLNVLFLGSLL